LLLLLLLLLRLLCADRQCGCEPNCYCQRQ